MNNFNPNSGSPNSQLNSTSNQQHPIVAVNSLPVQQVSNSNQQMLLNMQNVNNVAPNIPSSGISNANKAQQASLFGSSYSGPINSYNSSILNSQGGAIPQGNSQPSLFSYIPQVQNPQQVQPQAHQHVGSLLQNNAFQQQQQAYSNANVFQPNLINSQPQQYAGSLFQTNAIQQQQQTQINAPQQQQFPLNTTYIPQYQIPFGQGYGYNQVVNHQAQSSQVYNDDEKLIEKAKEESKDVKLQLQLKAQRSLIKLKTKTDLPVMATLKSSGGSRTSVDLICVIDNSGSMQGEKIELVKSTIRFLLETLTPSDRLSIITFNGNASRLCGLKCVTGENMQSLLTIVNGIHANGGTNINSGLQLALKVMRERKEINKVTSIFLLSDGQDKSAELSFKQSLQEPRNKQLGPFTLHSFGFGSDHDEQLMSKLCKIKDGAFYFIKELATLDEAFCNALGAIISLVANQVTIKISNVAKNIVEGVRIGKVYGQMWQKLNEKQYKIKINQLMSGITRDFVFELEIPAIDGQVGDINRDHNVIQGIFQAKSISNQLISGQCSLELTLLNESQNIPDTIQNVDVIENYLRVKAAEAIEENLKKADQHKYAEAQKGIDNMIQLIQDNKKARKQKMSNLITDLNQIKQKCSQQDYASQGRKWMMSAQQSHTMQNNFQYSNCVQSDMLTQIKSKKK